MRQELPLEATAQLEDWCKMGQGNTRGGNLLLMKRALSLWPNSEEKEGFARKC